MGAVRQAGLGKFGTARDGLAGTAAFVSVWPAEAWRGLVCQGRQGLDRSVLVRRGMAAQGRQGVFLCGTLRRVEVWNGRLGQVG